jgi:pimeloyl-ACP methyl ester carboxylesterase/DNA-binding CsgD family transcriptional regulator
LAEQLGETETRIHALTNVGSIRFLLDIDRGRREVEESLAFALQAGYEDHAARAYAVLGCNSTELYQFSKADQLLLAGIGHCAEHDLEGMRLYLVGWRATSLMFQGQWSEAARLAELVLAHPRLSPPSRIVSLVALGRVQSRQGNPSASAALDEALDLAMATGEFQRIAPVRAARAEAAWLAGDIPRVLAEARTMYDEARACRHIWYAGQFAFWLWRAGEAPEIEGLFEPFALQISGQWKEAAARWRAMGCPYESASALADSDDEADLRYALAEFNRLGAIPAAARVSQRLRELTASTVHRRVRETATPFTPPQVRYVKSGDVNIAYQVVGDGPLDLVFVMGWVSNLEYFWKGPFARFLQRLASFSRLILFDKRGTGLSDRVTELPTIEQRMDDVRAVMEAAGSERAALFGVSEGAPMCAVFAATYPERTTALVIYGGFARRLWAPDYPWAPTPEERNRYLDTIEQDWGNDRDLDVRAPSAAGDEAFREWWGEYLRMSASPGAARALARMNSEIDIRHLLPAIRVPSLIVHRTGDLRLPVEGGRYLADHIPGARFVELPGFDHLPFAGDQDAILDEVELFLTGAHSVFPSDRVLATVVSIEVAGAADRAAGMGDRKWRATLETHERTIAEALVRFHGDRIKSTADGLLASFDGPGRAIRFAVAVADAARRFGLETRAGLHTGECEKTGESLSGIALRMASRIMFRAEPGQVLVSSTVKDLVAGSGIAFDDLGEHVFAELTGDWRLFRVQQHPPRADVAPAVVYREPGPAAAAANPLSRREREVALLIVRGLSNRQIADEFSISPATVERHVSNIFNKLGYHSRAQIAAWAVERGLSSGQQ